MAYITAEYYSGTFHGHAIPSGEFDRIEADTETIIDGIVQIPVTDADKAADKFKKAVGYQMETLYVAGGMDAINAKVANGEKTNERLDDYSVTRQRVAEYPTVDGMPVSPMTINLLRQLGYLKRWVYSGGLPDA
jgi:hypothetical protein